MKKLSKNFYIRWIMIVVLLSQIIVGGAVTYVEGSTINDERPEIRGKIDFTKETRIHELPTPFNEEAIRESLGLDDSISIKNDTEESSKEETKEKMTIESEKESEKTSEETEEKNELNDSATSGIEEGSSELEGTTSVIVNEISPAAVITGKWGTVPYEFNDITGVLTFRGKTDGSDTLGGEITSPWNRPTERIVGADIKKIVFTEKVKTPTESSYLFSSEEKETQHLTNVELIEGIEKLDTRQTTNMEGMFSGMTSLKSLNLGAANFDTSNVTTMFGMFGVLPSLTSLNLGDKFDTSNVTSMMLMFGGLTTLRSLNLGAKFDTSKVSDMLFMFTGDESLEKLDLSQFTFKDTNVMVGAMFSDMSNLKELTLPASFKVFSKKTRTDTALPAITVTNDYTGNWMNSENVSVGTSKDFMENFGTEAVPAGTYRWEREQDLWGTVPFDFEAEKGILTFRGKSDGSDTLGEYTTSPWNRPNAKIVATDIKKIVFTEKVKTPINSNYLFSSNVVAQRLTKVASIDGVANLDTRQTTIMGFMFQEMSSLTSLDLGANFNTSNVTTMNMMFSGVKNLEKLNLSQFTFKDTNVIVAKMFNGMANLKELTLPTSFKVISQAARTGTNLPSIAAINSYTGNWMKSNNVSVGTTKAFMENFGTPAVLAGTYRWEQNLWGTVPYAFDNKTGVLTFDGKSDGSDTLGGYTTSPWNRPNAKIVATDIKKIVFTAKVKAPKNSEYLFSTFDGVGSLTNVESFERLDLLDVSQVTNMEGMFSFLMKLTKLDLSNNFNTSVVENMNKMFFLNVKLTNLNLGANFNTSSVKTMSDMFASNSELVSLNLGNLFDTSRVTDMSYMFTNLDKLTTLNFGQKFKTNIVENMMGMFSGMIRLEKLDLRQFTFKNGVVIKT